MIQDIILRTADHREFDVTSVEKYIVSLRYSARDPVSPHTFMLSYGVSGIETALHARADEPARFPGTVIGVEVAPMMIRIWYRITPVEPARHFVAWLRKHYTLRYEDADYGGDVPEVDDALEVLFGAIEAPFVQVSEDGGFALANDPEGVARCLLDALLSRSGSALREALAGGIAEVHGNPTVRVSRAGTGFRIVREDTGGELSVSTDTIDKLMRDAATFREAFLRDNLPLGATLDHARYELREELAGGADRGLYRGRDRERQTSVLISIGTPQRDPLDQVRQRLGYELPGIAALRHIGPVTATGEARYDGLVEDEPAGIPSADHPTVMDAATTARLGLAVAEVVAAAHARGIVLGGLRPELVYIDGDRVTGIAPRCDVFHAKMTKPDYGVPLCFPHVYFAPEVLARPEDPPTPAADVFALAAMIAYWHTGEHPFTGDYTANVIAIMSRQRTAWRGDAKLGAIVEAGLLPLPGRTTLDRLVAMLSKTFALGTS